jgi:hypothetical protein
MTTIPCEPPTNPTNEKPEREPLNESDRDLLIRTIEAFDKMRDAFTLMEKAFAESQRRPEWANDIMAAVSVIEPARVLQAEVFSLHERVTEYDAKLEECRKSCPMRVA